MEDQCITVLVKEGRGHNWTLTIIYASPQHHNRKHLWQYIGEMGKIVNTPWMVIGDVNQPLDNWDKYGADRSTVIWQQH